MKKLYTHLFFLIVLASCSQGTENADSALHDKISNFIKENANDPAAYQPVRFGQPGPWTKQDVNNLEAEDMNAKAQIAIDFMKQQAEREVRMVRNGATAAQVKPIKDSFAETEIEAKTFQHLEDSLRSANDTTRLGTKLTHAFRSKNKLGALVLDSATFLVHKNGTVSVL